MKKNYFKSVILGIMSLTFCLSQSQNLLFDGDFSLTTEIIPFDGPSPPLNQWAFWVNYSGNGSEANPTVVDGVCNFHIINPGDESWNVQLAQWGFPLTQGHTYQLSFDVKADSDRSFGVYLGEDGGNWFDLIGYDRYWYYATTEWQNISIDFDATLAFTLHKLSFELGGNNTNMYFDNVVLQDLGPAPPDKVVIAGTFQSALNCASDWDPNCDETELTHNSSTGLYTGVFQLPEGTHRYKATVGGSWDINYGENGLMGGADIYLCVPSGSEDITFTYDPSTHLVTTSPIVSGFSPECLPVVVLAGTFQDELGCYGDWVADCTNTALIYNWSSGLFEGDLNIPTGCYDYRVVLDNNWQNNFGQEGIHNGPNYSISIPTNPDITHFTYDPVSHVVSSTPYSGAPEDVTKVSLIGSLQDELGCPYEHDYECENPALLFNPSSGAWEGSFTLPSGCYVYQVKETVGCNNVTMYGENGIQWGEFIQLYVPSDAEITFSYDPLTHIITSTPYSGAPLDVIKVSLYGTLQNELGCDFDYNYECDDPALQFNSNSGSWEGSFALPVGCYTYRILERDFCDNVTFYGENGTESGNEIQLYLPSDAEITFSYDPKTHIMSSTPYSSAPEEVTKVSLYGALQDELGCTYDHDYECENPALLFNSGSSAWEGSFALPAGCYTYLVKETFGCNNVTLYGENGTEWGNEIQLYVPLDGEITFSYDPQTHIVTSTPYSGAPQEVIKVSLYGTLQDELGCAYDYDYECDSPALVFNSGSGLWEGNFTLPSGCYIYRVKQTFGCNSVTVYGENGIESGNDIQLNVPTDGEITFSYDPQTHIISSLPYSSGTLEVSKVSLMGTLQNELGCTYDYDYECDSPALVFNSSSSLWEGNFTLPSGCYTYRVKETFGCNFEAYYGENGIQWGNEIEVYLPLDGEINFSYDSQTHIVSSTPSGGAPQEVTKVTLTGSFQYELGCAYDGENECDHPALVFNSGSGAWEGSFTLPAGCYTYRVKETFGCNTVTYYGENGIVWGSEIQLYVPLDGEITFTYDPQTHMISSTPYSGVPQEVTTVSLQGTLQDELGCASDYEYQCDHPMLLFNPNSGAWEGSFALPAGCYTYIVKETFGCSNAVFYGENGIVWGNQIQLYVPSDGEISFSYDPQTHIISSTPYTEDQVVKVSLQGTLQDELGCEYDYQSNCNYSELIFNSDSGTWEGSFTLPAGCYYYWVNEISFCNNETQYGDNGIAWGNAYQLYIPSDGEMTFSYDPQTHIMSSTPYSGVPQEVTKVSLFGTLQDELGCAYDYDYECDNLSLSFNPNLGTWEGSFILPPGCYTYLIKEAFGCFNVTLYGDNGNAWGEFIQLYVLSYGEITFSYDPQTHIMTSTPDIPILNECPNTITVNNSPGSCGAIVDYPEFVATANCGGDVLSITQTEGLPSGSMFPVGITTNSFLITKTIGEEETCSFDVVVFDTESPVISDLNEVYDPLWPPNHKMVPVFIGYSVTDNCSVANIELYVSSNEPENGLGDGDTAPDWKIVDEHNVLLRAERSGKGNGRQYTITIRAIDETGNYTEQYVFVRVSSDNRRLIEGFSNPELGFNEFTLYPNPANDIIHIKGIKSSQNTSYYIYDMFGSVMRDGVLKNNKIDVSTLPQGMYILKFETDKEHFFKKFIKN